MTSTDKRVDDGGRNFDLENDALLRRVHVLENTINDFATSLHIAFDEGFDECRTNQHLEKAWQNSRTKQLADSLRSRARKEPRT